MMGQQPPKSHKEQTFNRDIGQKAHIEREDIADGVRANERLDEIGHLLHPNPDGAMKYVGSLAVHIYVSEVLGFVQYVSQTAGAPANGCTEPIALRAVQDLEGSVLERYGKKRRVLRSGF